MVNAAHVIAIVDDDPSVRRSLLRVVTSAGYEAVAFASARKFLEWLAIGRADCLVLDVHMDGMNGFELQQRLAVPVIFITAHDDATTHARIQKSAAAAHLKKPVAAQTILDAIRRITASDGLGKGPIEPSGNVGESGSSDKEAK